MILLLERATLASPENSPRLFRSRIAGISSTNCYWSSLYHRSSLTHLFTTRWGGNRSSAAKVVTTAVTWRLFQVLNSWRCPRFRPAEPKICSCRPSFKQTSVSSIFNSFPGFSKIPGRSFFIVIWTYLLVSEHQPDLWHQLWLYRLACKLAATNRDDVIWPIGHNPYLHFHSWLPHPLLVQVWQPRAWIHLSQGRLHFSLTNKSDLKWASLFFCKDDWRQEGLQPKVSIPSFMSEDLHCIFLITCTDPTDRFDARAELRIVLSDVSIATARFVFVLK